jgi:hypothetical protein
VAAYAVLGGSITAMCPRELRRLPDAKALAIAFAGAAVFLAAVEFSDLFGLTSPWARLFVAGGFWVLLYVLPALALDGRLRQLLMRRNSSGNAPSTPNRTR